MGMVENSQTAPMTNIQISKIFKQCFLSELITNKKELEQFSPNDDENESEQEKL